MRQFAPVLISALVCLPALAADVPPASPAKPTVQVREEIVAKVNGDIITKTELEKTRREMEAEAEKEGQRARASAGAVQAALAQRDRDVLRDRIDQLLLAQRGKELNLNVDSEVSKRLASIRSDYKIADDEAFDKFIREQTGQSLPDFKNEIKNQILTQRVIGQEVASKINVPKAELVKYYNEHKAEFVRQEQVFLREIMVSTDGKDATGVAQAEKKARDLVARARKGEKFGELARDNSDAVTAKEGGALPPFKKGDLDPKLDAAVWSRTRGYVTDPIRLDKGFEILRVEDHQQAGQASEADVEQEIMQRLYEPRMQPEVRKYLTHLREQAFLEIKPGYLDSGAAPGKSTAWQDPAQLKPQTITKEEVLAKGRRRKILGVPVGGHKSAAPAADSVSSSKTFK